MKNGWLKNSMAFLLLALFLSMKMLGLHALSHENEKGHAVQCAICDHVIANNLTPALTPDLQEFIIENTEYIVRREISKTYNFIISNSIVSNQLFSRPPPFFL